MATGAVPCPCWHCPCLVTSWRQKSKCELSFSLLSSLTGLFQSLCHLLSWVSPVMFAVCFDLPAPRDSWKWGQSLCSWCWLHVPAQSLCPGEGFGTSAWHIIAFSCLLPLCLCLVKDSGSYSVCIICFWRSSELLLWLGNLAGCTF